MTNLLPRARGEEILQDLAFVQDRQRVVAFAFDEAGLAVRQARGERFGHPPGKARVVLPMPEADRHAHFLRIESPCAGINFRVLVDAAPGGPPRLAVAIER